MQVKESGIEAWKGKGAACGWRDVFTSGCGGRGEILPQRKCGYAENGETSRAVGAQGKQDAEVEILRRERRASG